MHLIKRVSTLIGTLISNLACIFLLTGCVEDLNPSSKDLREDQILTAENFTAITTLNESIILEDELLTHDAVVLYFTMWCSLCDQHMDHMRRYIIDDYPNVRFLMVDYVSGNIDQAHSSQLNSGYADLTVLVDNENALLTSFNATMASVIVIDDQNNILLNEDYKNGSRLIDTLKAL